mmetsp:Transcript_33290/g.76805  ORF Transcript_33290/g.76805 Transcript_33290/m.76805 type:complete len:122 (-) Transcript_33290:53-418(-)
MTLWHLLSHLLLLCAADDDGPRHHPEMMDFRGYVKGMDKDGDGFLSLEEAVRSITDVEGVQNPDHPDIRAEREKQIRILRENFAKSDSNGDGKLTYREALFLLKHLGGIDIIPEDAAHEEL